MTTILTADGLSVFHNPRAAAPAEPYGATRAAILDEQGFDAAEREITQWPGYAPTALHALPALAGRLGLGRLCYKDESTRFGLKSFKALGGAYAVFRLIQKAVAARHNGHVPGAAEILSGAYRDIVSALTVTCATDGNHGRSVAWGAQLFGCRCVIYIHATVSDGRRDAIAHYGAEVVRVPGNYDDSVRHAAAEAERNGWTVVSDTTYEGYRDIPIDVMHGYGVMSREIVHALDDAPPTHVIVQAGVGALAASVCANFWLAWGERRPRFIVVEPQQADCLFESGRAGHPVAIHGELDTVMAGLACGEVSPVAWEILRDGADFFSTVADRFALEAMRVFARPAGTDPAIVAGETGGSGLALLLAAAADADIWHALGLGPHARVLLIGSEGDTDPQIYRNVVGLDAAEVLA
ncbi:MAG TPA: diaminopropionate ammonia-lyase [Rhodocyclaceae bacterium]|nr:diaminopropionate ammonia-lyase [Rhodocyclaceae bacterium]